MSLQDPLERRRARRRVPPALSLRTPQGRRRRALRLDLAARLGHEASPVEQSQLDQLVTVYMQLEGPDIAYQPAFQLALRPARRRLRRR
jgi:hypothetical protein